MRAHGQEQSADHQSRRRGDEREHEEEVECALNHGSLRKSGEVRDWPTQSVFHWGGQNHESRRQSLPHFRQSRSNADRRAGNPSRACAAGFVRRLDGGRGRLSPSCRGCRPRGGLMRWLRGACVWLLLMAAEVVHGVARTLFLAPAVGDFRARQLAVVSGSLLILAVTSVAIRWMRPGTNRSLVGIGVMWVVLTLGFEVSVGRLVGYSWSRIASDYNLLQGGLLPIGLTVMAMSPWMASRLRHVSILRKSSSGAL